MWYSRLKDLFSSMEATTKWNTYTKELQNRQTSCSLVFQVGRSVSQTKTGLVI